MITRVFRMFQSSGEWCTFWTSPESNTPHSGQELISRDSMTWNRCLRKRTHSKCAMLGDRNGVVSEVINHVSFRRMLFSGQWGYGSDSRARFSWGLLGLERECVVWTAAVMNYSEEGMMTLTQSKTVHQRVTRSQPQQRLSPGGYWWTLINHSISCPHLRAALITSHAPAQTHTLL